jgi:small-conductance mechanosensitive channel
LGFTEQVTNLYQEIPLFAEIPFLAKKLLGNPVQSWLIALAFGSILGMILIYIKNLFSHRLQKRAKQSVAKWDDDVLNIYSRTKSNFILILAIYIAFQGLSLSKRVEHFIDVGFAACFFAQMFVWADRAILVAIRRQGRVSATKHSDFKDPKDIILSFVGRFLIYTIIVLMFLDNLGVNITALVTGLGVGGIAIALAVQNILGDLIASISIAMDKPFAVGETIAVSGSVGTVEKIGLKTSRIRSLNGELIILPNSDILKQCIQNYKHLTERRVTLRLGIVYETPEDKAKLVTTLIQQAVTESAKTRFERAHFYAFGPSSLDFECMYWILDSEYLTLMDCQQDVNFKILKLFKDHDIRFAYPPQTVYYQQSTLS